MKTLKYPQNLPKIGEHLKLIRISKTDSKGITELQLYSHGGIGAIYGHNSFESGIYGKDSLDGTTGKAIKPNWWEGGVSISKLKKVRFNQYANIYLHGCHGFEFAKELYTILDEMFKNKGGFKGKIYARDYSGDAADATTEVPRGTTTP